MKQITLNIIVFLISLWCWSSPVLATGKTNVNEVNDLFDRHIENKDRLMRDLQEQREGAVRQIEAGNGLEHIEGINEAEGKARELESIREVDLESSGRQKRVSEEYRFYDENELEPDYSKPGNLTHKRDADEIIAQTGIAMQKLGKDLQTRLSAVGIDCHQVKGPIQKDLTYHIEIEGIEHRNSEYEQVFCEEPRNRYNCHDVLTTKCKRRGAVGELKHVVIDRFFVSQLLEGTRRLGYDDSKVLTELYGTTEPLHLLASSRFIIPEGHVADMVPYSSVIKEIIIKSINTDTITVPPHRWYWPRITRMHEYDIDARIHRMAVQKRTGEWYEEQIIRIKNGFKLYYYDEGCVDWVDEWDEVCGLES